MTDITNKIHTIVSDIYSHNKFMQWCGIKIVTTGYGTATVSIKIDPQLHANLNGMAHGGLIATLVDNTTGIGGATIGKRVVTDAITINFIKGAPVGTTIYARSVITYADENLITLNIEVREMDTEVLIAKGSASMIVVADFPEIIALLQEEKNN